MQNPFTNLFIFTKTERNGVLGLVLLVLIVLSIRYGWKTNYESEVYDYTQFEAQLANLVVHQDSIEQKKKSYTNYNSKTGSVGENKPSHISKPKYSIEPNSATLDDWKQLGFSTKQAEMILKYRQAGAVFRKKKDLLKLFVIDEQKLDQIDEYIRIDEKNLPARNNKLYARDKPSFVEEKFVKKPFKKFQKKAVIPPLSIPINSADTTQLKTIHGIGSYYAKSIVKFRDMTGGIYSDSQFSEIYGVRDDDGAIDSLKKYVVINDRAIVKINVNKCTHKELSKLFYVKWSVAKAIVAYREMHGAYRNVEDIGKSDLVSDELVSKIAPYIKLNDD